MDKDTTYFISLIYQFNELAMMALGKVPGPDGKVGEVLLENAHYAIDVIEMLERRTKGNLSEEETRYVQQTLTNLRLNYLDEVNKSDAAKTA